MSHVGLRGQTAMDTDSGSAADLAELQALLEAWAEAIVSDDADRIGGFAEPDWQLVTPESGPVPRERFLSAVRSGDLTHDTMTFEVQHVRRLGGVTVVVAHGTSSGRYRGQRFSAEEWVTDCFVRRADRWSCALSALTPDRALDPTTGSGGDR